MRGWVGRPQKGMYNAFALYKVSIMPVIKYRVILTDKERNKLTKIISKGSASAKSIMHAHVLLAADEGSSPKRSEKEIADLFQINDRTVHTIRKTYDTKGLNAAIRRKKRQTPPIQAKITGVVESKIIALSCSEPPEGRSKWTLRLLADKIVELQIMESISHESVYRLLKKTN